MAEFDSLIPIDKNQFTREEVVRILGSAFASREEKEKKLQSELDELHRQKNYWTVEHEKSLQLIMENSVQKIELEELNKKLKKALEEIEIESRTDYLTKLLNRGALIRALQKEMKMISRTKEKVMRRIIEFENQDKELEIDTFFNRTGDLGNLSAAIIDIDHFKIINDTYGHLIGDEVLKKIGEILKDPDLLRSTDISGRFGGEEFLIIFPQTSCNHALIPLEKIAGAIRGFVFSPDGNRSFSITASIGVADYCISDTSIEDMIRRADTALYYAKEHGRNRIIPYNASLM